MLRLTIGMNAGVAFGCSGTLLSQERMTVRQQRSGFVAFAAGFFYVSFCLIALAFGTSLGWIGRSSVLQGIVMGSIKNTQPETVFGSSQLPKNSITLLILGCDREYEVNKWGAKVVSEKWARSDMMMVAKLDFANDTVGAVSIPRDTLCGFSDYSRQKINAYHKIGGPDLSRRAVEALLPGVVIDRVVVLDFQAFQDVVDMLGGVEVYVPKDMKYDDNWADLHIDLKKGRRHLDGYEAMGFVRFRKGKHGQSDSDFERQKRQKELMMALKSKMMGNIGILPEIADKSIALTGNAFTPDEMAALIMFTRSVQPDNIRMGQIPVVDVAGTFNLEVDRSKRDEVLSEFRILDSRYGFARSE